MPVGTEWESARGRGRQSRWQRHPLRFANDATRLLDASASSTAVKCGERNAKSAPPGRTADMRSLYGLAVCPPVHGHPINIDG